jgi:polysaccharide export outer membrane protein
VGAGWRRFQRRHFVSMPTDVRAQIVANATKACGNTFVDTMNYRSQMLSIKDVRMRIAFLLLFLLVLLAPAFTQDTLADGILGFGTYISQSSDLGDLDFNIKNPGNPGDHASEAPTGATAPGAQEMLLLSRSTQDYPVTPGDVYQLTYITAGMPVETTTVVASDFSVHLGVLGTIDAAGLSFLDLRTQIEQKTLRAYPDSSPSITIVSIGQFQVYIKGEVQSAGFHTAWGLTRLSQVLADYLTPYSSTRDVRIISINGQETQYDLFQAKRFGERDQDPYVCPDDTIDVSERDRAIRLRGAVKREGIYQPLASEGLQELIEVYGGGFRLVADASRVRLQRMVTDGSRIAESFVLDLKEGFDQSVELRDLDTIFVPSKTEYMPVLFIEGAIYSEHQHETNKSDNSNNNTTEEYNRLVFPFAEGDTLYSLLHDKSEHIYSNADLNNAYVIRRNGNEVIPVNLENLLYAYNPEDDIVIEPSDRLVIPAQQYSVLVTGGVHDPGKYPYLPNKTFRYYVDLAGGVQPNEGNIRGVRIIDKNNTRISNDQFIKPETRIHVPYSFTYYFLRYAPIAISSVTAVYYTVLILEIYDKIP